MDQEEEESLDRIFVAGDDFEESDVSDIEVRYVLKETTFTF